LSLRLNYVSFFPLYDPEKLPTFTLDLCIRHGVYLLTLSYDSNIVSVVSTLDSIFQKKSIQSLPKTTQDSLGDLVTRLLLKQLVFSDDKLLLSFITCCYPQLYQRFDKKRKSDVKTHFSDLLSQEIESCHDREPENQKKNLISLVRVLCLLEQVFLDTSLKEQMLNEDSQLFKVLKEEYVDRESVFVSMKSDWVVFVEVFNRITH